MLESTLPAVGVPIELYWDEAGIRSATELADALKAAARDPGSTADVPDALRDVHPVRGQAE
jgi:hypothetical protein